MALKAQNQIKTQLGATVLTLRADPGEAFLVKQIKIYSAAGTYVTLKTEKTTVGYLRVDQTYGNHLAFPLIETLAGVLNRFLPKNLLDFLFGAGIFKGYPVAEGESFIISGAEGAADIKSIVYDILEPADIKNTDPNGSKAQEYFMISYGDTGAAISTAGDQELDNPLCPAEFPAFPFSKEVPSRFEILVHGITGSEVAVVNATPALAIYTRYLKLIKDREVLFDEDRNGILFDSSRVTLTAGTYIASGHSLIGAMNEIDPRPPLLFPEPLLFDQGDELNAYITTVEPVDASTITALQHVIGFIETVRRKTA